MLLAMHYIVPKASFVGHLSGILVGYPLAWGLLAWLGLEALARLSVVASIIRDVYFGNDRRIVSIAGTSSGVMSMGDHNAAVSPIAVRVNVLALYVYVWV